ncbi:MAG: tetratricopeptide repeat protein [Candidatus Brocadiia bacterium]|jgi:tetratricopeptide (TPR) repeat protein
MDLQAAVNTGNAGAPRRRQILLAVALVAVTLLAYLPAMRGGFIWNDDTFLTRNPLIKTPDGLRRLWFTTDPPDYFPLTSTSLWLEWRLWGMNPARYHVVNVLLHALSAVLLWRVLKRLKAPGAWLAGLIFAVHPVNVESVAWITERKNTLAMVLYMASLLAYLKFDEDGALRAYVVTLGLFLLALLAKTSVIMLPAVLLLCAWWRRGRIGRKDILRATPFAAVSGALALVTVWYQYNRAIAAEVVRTDGFLARTAGAGWASWFYLYKALLPAKLCFVYPRWALGVSFLSFVPDLLLLALLIVLWRNRRGWGRPLLFGFGYFLVSLAPVAGFMNIYFMRYSLVADHWQYTAMIGIAALAGGVLAGHAERRGAIRKVEIAAAAALVAVLAAATWNQSLIYRDAETVWRDTVRKNPAAWMAWNNLAVCVKERAEAAQQPAQAAELSKEAIGYCEKAIALKPDYAEAYATRGAAWYSLGRRDLALRDYDLAIASRADYAEAWILRGRLHADSNRLDEAMGDYDRAIVLRPDFAVAYCERGNVQVRARRYADAVRDYTHAIALNENLAEAYNDRAVAYLYLKEYAKGLADVKICQKLGGRPARKLVEDLTQAADRKE